jgi:hypothetical protein
MCICRALLRPLKGELWRRCPYPLNGEKEKNVSKNEKKIMIYDSSVRA